MFQKGKEASTLSSNLPGAKGATGEGDPKGPLGEGNEGEGVAEEEPLEEEEFSSEDCAMCNSSLNLLCLQDHIGSTSTNNFAIYRKFGNYTYFILCTYHVKPVVKHISVNRELFPN